MSRRKNKAVKEAPKKPKPRKFHVHRTPDPFKQAAASRILDHVQTALPEPKEATLPTLVEAVEGSAEEKAFHAAAASTRALLARRPELTKNVVALEAFRRCYAVTYLDLQRQLTGEEGKIDVMVEDLLVQSAVHSAAKPFSEHQLMQNLIETVLPWLASAVDAHMAADETAEREERNAAETSRKARPLSLGFKYDQLCEEPVLERHRALALVGDERGVAWLLDRIVETVLVDKNLVIRLAEKAGPKDQSVRLIRLAANLWTGCCNTARQLATMMGEHVAGRLTTSPDLLICDNLALAFTGGFSGRPGGASAGDAHKRLRDWCDKGGVGLIGAVPFAPDECPLDIKEPCYEQLRTFTHLRTVQVLDKAEGLDADHYRVVVGNYVAMFDVARNVLDGYARSTIVLPAGVQT